jgi:hypothetical protein
MPPARWCASSSRRRRHSARPERLAVGEASSLGNSSTKSPPTKPAAPLPSAATQHPSPRGCCCFLSPAAGRALAVATLRARLQPGLRLRPYPVFSLKIAGEAINVLRLAIRPSHQNVPVRSAFELARSKRRFLMGLNHAVEYGTSRWPFHWRDLVWANAPPFDNDLAKAAGSWFLDLKPPTIWGVRISRAPLLWHSRGPRAWHHRRVL